MPLWSFVTKHIWANQCPFSSSYGYKQDFFQWKKPPVRRNCQPCERVGFLLEETYSFQDGGRNWKKPSFFWLFPLFSGRNWKKVLGSFVHTYYLDYFFHFFQKSGRNLFLLDRKKHFFSSGKNRLLEETANPGPRFLDLLVYRFFQWKCVSGGGKIKIINSFDIWYFKIIKT